LVARCGLATNYHAIAHPSLPNYVAITSGNTHGIGDDEDPSAHPLGGASLFGQLGGSWRAVEESMPQPLYAVGRRLLRGASQPAGVLHRAH
jgi:hypothetical protein